MSGPPPPPPPPPPSQPRPYQQQPHQQQYPGQAAHARFPQQMRPGMNMPYGQHNRPYQPMQGGQMAGGMRPPQMYQQRPRPPYGMNQQSGYMQQRYQNQGNARPMSGYNGGQQQRPQSYMQGQDDGDQGQPKKQMQRKTIDYYGATVRGLELRAGGTTMSLKNLPSDPSYTVDVFPPIFVPNEPETSLTTRFIWDAKNKVRYPINVIRWMPEGRWLITGSSSGELTLWNGLTFKFESILSAHDKPIRAMEWSHDSQWMITGDHGGIIKYFQPNLDNVKIIQGHREPVRGLSLSPSDAKFVSASEDQQLKVWDFRRGEQEQVLSGHSWAVRAVDWHPQKGMIVSGGKDNIIKLWDPRTGSCISSFGRHNNSVTSLEWNRNGNWLISGGRDHCIKLFDIRNLKEEVRNYSTEKREIHSIAWHPIHETLFASGGTIGDNNMANDEGTIQFWTTDEEKQRGAIEGAHGSCIWSLDWHPMGHILASGSNDHSTRFWGRPRPGERIPTELGSQDDVDVRLFGDTLDPKAEEKLACFAQDKPRPATAGASHNLSYDSDSSAPLSAGSTRPTSGAVPGLQSGNIGRMLANIKAGISGLPGLPGLGNKNVPPPPPPPPASAGLPGLPGLSRPPTSLGLPGLSNQGSQPGASPQGGPARHTNTRQRQTSRFNPIQRNGDNNNNNNNDNNGNGNNAQSGTR